MLGSDPRKLKEEIALGGSFLRPQTGIKPAKGQGNEQGQMKTIIFIAEGNDKR